VALMLFGTGTLMVLVELDADLAARVECTFGETLGQGVTGRPPADLGYPCP
jgi:hypothetical protein